MNISKTVLKRRLLPVILTGFALCLAFILHSFVKWPIQSSRAQPTAYITTVHKQKKVISGLPVRLKIPKISVDASIEDMGLTSAGNMDVPASIIDAGWYKYGPHPGNAGSAVIAGHLDGVQGEPGVFIDLNKLQPGDSLATIDDKGRTTAFVVRGTRTYGQNERPSEVFTATSGAHLNLITCTGAWDTAQHRFAQRLVVFADKVVAGST